MSAVIISEKIAVASVAFTLTWQLEVIILTAYSYDPFVVSLSFISGVIPP